MNKKNRYTLLAILNILQCSQYQHCRREACSNSTATFTIPVPLRPGQDCDISSRGHPASWICTTLAPTYELRVLLERLTLTRTAF